MLSTESGKNTRDTTGENSNKVTTIKERLMDYHRLRFLLERVVVVEGPGTVDRLLPFLVAFDLPRSCFGETERAAKH
jgi:hypothetical protein